MCILIDDIEWEVFFRCSLQGDRLPADGRLLKVPLVKSLVVADYSFTRPIWLKRLPAGQTTMLHDHRWFLSHPPNRKSIPHPSNLPVLSKCL